MVSNNVNSSFPLNIYKENPGILLCMHQSSECLDSCKGAFQCCLIDTYQGPPKSMDETSENHPTFKFGSFRKYRCSSLVFPNPVHHICHEIYVVWWGVVVGGKKLQLRKTEQCIYSIRSKCVHMCVSVCDCAFYWAWKM